MFPPTLLRHARNQCSYPRTRYPFSPGPPTTPRLLGFLFFDCPLCSFLSLAGKSPGFFICFVVSPPWVKVLFLLRVFVFPPPPFLFFHLKDNEIFFFPGSAGLFLSFDSYALRSAGAFSFHFSPDILFSFLNLSPFSSLLSYTFFLISWRPSVTMGDCIGAGSDYS